MTLVYRSVRVVVQNSTPLILTVEGAEVLMGEWTPGTGMNARGAVVHAQSAAAVMTQSTALQVGCEAFVRFGSVHGAIHLHWSLPWVGSFALTSEAGSDFAITTTVMDSDPAAIVALVVLQVRT